MNWVCVNRTPIAKAKDLEAVEYPGDARTLSKKAKAQMEAARKAASPLLAEFDGPVNVALSGYASTKDDPEPDQVQIKVAKA